MAGHRPRALPVWGAPHQTAIFVVQEARSAVAGDAEARGDGAPGAPSRQEGPRGLKKRRRARRSGNKHVARNLRKLAAFNSAHDTDAAAAEPEGDHTHGGT